MKTNCYHKYSYMTAIIVADTVYLVLLFLLVLKTMKVVLIQIAIGR